MKVEQNAALLGLNTFGVNARTGMLLTIESEEDLLTAPAFDPGKDVILGGGSNVLLLTDVPGTVYLNRIRGIERLQEDDAHALVEVGAGENWHELVLWSLSCGFSGLENLSLIPGLAGAAPMQNIGAYGVELASLLHSVTAWDWRTAAWKVFDHQDCRFGYRDSRFKSTEPGRYLITSIRLKLDRRFSPRLGYAGLREELQKMGKGNPAPADVSEAVMRIRRRKLPDPATTGNAGSFFKNPVVPAEHAEALSIRHPGLRHWPAEHGRKLSAGWMIEHCGLKGYRKGGAGVSPQHALVLVNHGTATGRDIEALAEHVRTTVHGEFGLWLEPEPVMVRF